MNVHVLEGLALEGVVGAVPANAEDNLSMLTALYGGDAAKAAAVVKTTGVVSRRVAAPGVSSLDLCCRAAERLFALTGVAPEEVGAVVAVSFTPERAMPCNACRAQSRLALPPDAPCFDLNLACSGYPYGLYAAGLLARQTGRRVLLLDGDVQTPRLAAGDAATRAVLADAGSATFVAPAAAPVAPWRFAFHTDGAKGDALSLPFGGTLAMDGFGVFKFVASDVAAFLKDFLAAAGEAPAAFAPHQPNCYLVRQLAATLGLREKTWLSADRFGNSASASVPVTLAAHAADCAASRGTGPLFLAGFGGGLSASAALVGFPARAELIET